MKLFIPNALWLPPACSWYMSSKSASNGVNAALTPPSIITMPINKKIKWISPLYWSGKHLLKRVLKYNFISSLMRDPDEMTIGNAHFTLKYFTCMGWEVNQVRSLQKCREWKEFVFHSQVGHNRRTWHQFSAQKSLPRMDPWPRKNQPLPQAVLK